MLKSCAVLYDFLQVNGGAERVSRVIAMGLPAKLMVHSVGAGQSTDLSSLKVQAISRRSTPRGAIARGLAAWSGFELLRVQPEVSGAIFSGHYAPLAWRAFPNARKVLYLHAPPLPFHFDAGEPAISELPRGTSLFLRPGFRLLERRYRMAVDRMDQVLANSAFVAQRFKALLGREVEVLPPPVDARFSPRERISDDPGYWVSFARHEPMKRVDRVIDAFRMLPDQSLVVAGIGSCTKALIGRARDAPNIRFVGSLDTDSLADCLAGACGSLHVSRKEPYGLAVAESLAAGVFTIVSREGGMAEQVSDGENGFLLPENPSPDQIAEAVRRRGGATWSRVHTRKLMDEMTFLSRLNELLEA